MSPQHAHWGLRTLRFVLGQSIRQRSPGIDSQNIALAVFPLRDGIAQPRARRIREYATNRETRPSDNRLCAPAFADSRRAGCKDADAAVHDFVELLRLPESLRRWADIRDPRKTRGKEC